MRITCERSRCCVIGEERNANGRAKMRVYSFVTSDERRSNVFIIENHGNCFACR